MTGNLLFILIKLIVTGIVTFFSILVFSKTKSGAWTAMITGFILNFVYFLYEIMTELQILPVFQVQVYGIPLLQLILFLLPQICFITAFLLFLHERG